MAPEERIWISVVLAVVVIFLGLLGYAAWGLGYITPYQVDKVRVSAPEKFQEALFQEFKPGVKEVEPGVYEVYVLAQRFQWNFGPPDGKYVTTEPHTNKPMLILKNPKKIIFKITSIDVQHGFEIAGTNVNVMVIPGYIATVTWVPPPNAKGIYLVVCNEYCGTGHQDMFAFIKIER